MTTNHATNDQTIDATMAATNGAAERQRVAVLGLGSMGSRMAANLASAGFAVTVWNRSSGPAEALAGEHPVIAATDPRAAAADADVVISMVADDAAARGVWLDRETGVLAAMKDGAVAVESSTLSASTIRELGDTAAAAGVAFLEAPVVGSRPQADAGALFVLVGGEAEVLHRVRVVLEVNAGAVRHVGGVGTAAAMKLAINGLFGIQVAAYAEIAGLLARSDVDTAQALDVLGGLPITSPGLQRILGLIGAGDYSPNFPVQLVAKDFGYLTDLAGELGAEVPIAAAAEAVFAAGASGEQRELDIAGIATRYLTSL